MDDKTIIAYYNARDEKAISHTQAQFGSYLTAIANRILSNIEDAKECVNDAIFRAWNSIPPDEPSSLKAYVAVLTRRLSINRYHEKKAKRRNRDFDLSLEELEECIPLPDEQAGDLPALLDAFLAGLDPLERKLFCGRYWHGYSMDILASTYGLTVNAVTLRVARTRKKLQSYLAERGYSV